jgi:hypothetical protein
MTTRRVGPFDATSFAAGLASAAPLLLVVAFFASMPAPIVGATLAITGLALGAVAAGVFVATHFIPSQNEES